MKLAFGPELFEKLELCEADTRNEKTMINAGHRCTYFIHCASPNVWMEPENVNLMMVKPMVKNNLAACKSCLVNKIKKLVILSSTCCISDSSNPKQTHFTKDWTSTKHAKNYPRCKTHAEKAAWNFKDKTGHRFEMVSICAGLILGPTLMNAEFNSG